MPTNTPALGPDQQFEVIYRDHSRQITTHIAANLYRTDRHLAEDLTAETFIRLWRSLTAGIQVEHPRALLNTIAGRAIADHFRRASSREAVTDFTVGNHTEVASGAAYVPHLSLLLAEVEQAEQHLTEACDAYKALTQRYASACGLLALATPEQHARAVIRRDRAVLLREAALDEFAAAALAAARARAAWNAGADTATAGRAELKAAA
jgi:DNA-directed RNA polymerase specialized sigma24 family protein